MGTVSRRIAGVCGSVQHVYYSLVALGTIWQLEPRPDVPLSPDIMRWSGVLFVVVSRGLYYTEQPVEEGGRVPWERRLYAGGKRTVHEPFDEDVLLGVRAGWLAGERGLQRLVALTGRLRALPGAAVDEFMT